MSLLRWDLQIISLLFMIMFYLLKEGMLVGPGRGSAAGSLVSYVLGITDVDPLKYRLMFERFLNKERVSMPDIDVDFLIIKDRSY